MALSLGLGCLAGCGGSGSSTTTTGPAPSITSFTATPASITAGASASLTGVFSGGTGVITPGNLPATSGTAVSVTPTATTTYTLTVTATNGTVVTKAVTVTVNVPSYVLTVNSTDPASGVEISYGDPVTNLVAREATPFTATYSSGTTVTLTAPAVAGNQMFLSWTGCTSATTVVCTVTMSADTTVTANYAAPATPIYVLTVESANPASGVAIGASPADLNSIATGTTAFTLSYASGTAVTLTAPATIGSSAFSSWTGCATAATVTCNVTMSADTAVSVTYTTTPTVTVTPSLTVIGTTQPLSVTVAVSGGSGNPEPTGSVTLTSGSYTSTAATLSGGSATITVPGGSLAAGSDTLKAAYTPDSASSSIYNTATGTSAAVTVSVPSQVTVTTPSTTLKATDKILGMNLATWYDVISNKDAIVSAYGKAGIKAVRWPGGSWSDDYHWATNTGCGIEPKSNDTFANFVNDIVTPASLDLTLTANYGSNTACTGGGEPSEAAAWVAEAKTLKANVTHVTVGNEVYGASWEEDLHTSAHDPATYAAAVAGASGYYDLIKAADSSVKVGVVVEEDNVTSGWDNTVLTNANGYYDFVEYHDYPETPGQENDSFLVTQAAQGLTANINKIKAEMAKWGTTVPIYVGEIGGPYSNPGKQSWSITQGLYAGQVLGEVMNDGVERLTWWIGFGNCTSGNTWNDSASLYGWQDFGAYNVFSDGPSDTDCPGAGPIGTMSPTARAFQLFSNVAVTGEDVLTAGVTGDTTDVRAYAATHDSGAATAVAVFNLNETTSEPVVITVPAPSTASKVTVITYDKSIYDLSGSPTGVFPDANGTSTWADPTTTTITSPTLPLTLTLTPWSMNVVIVE
jgi:hypothetical protein